MVGRSGVVGVGLLVLVATVAGTGLATPVAGTGADPGGTTASTQETDSTVTRISVASNGSATWEVQVRTRLTSDADVAEYEAFQERFRENTSEFLDPFRERMRGVVAEASDETGRPMEATDFSAETGIQTVPRRWGVVTYEFEWRHFAAHDGDALVVGDVFRGQLFLTRNDTLAVTAPGGYAVTSVEPSPAERDAGTVRWFGQRSFPDDTPAVRFEPTAPTATGTDGDAGGGTDRPGGTDTPGETGGTNETDAPAGTTPPDGTATAAPPDSGGGSALPLAAAVLVAGLLAVAGYRVYAGDAGPGGTGPGGEGPPATRGGDATASGDGAGSAAAAGDADGDAAAGTADGTGVGNGTGPRDGASAAAGTVDPDPVLTDADRVEQLLTGGGGQMRQSEIVDALDWSKSKTSRVLSDMAEEDRVDKLRIGRENVIRLPTDEDLTDSGDEIE